MNKVICLDIGNRNIKIGVFENKKRKPELFIEEKENTIKILEKITKKYKVKKIYGISVVPFIEEKISNRFNIRFLVHQDFKEIKNPYKEKERIGIDRIVNVYSAINLYKTDSIVMDFGTAITVDVVKKNGNFIGGLIIPSFKTQLEVLNRSTELINIKNLKLNFRLTGKSTEECVSYGIIGVLIYGLKGIVEGIKKRYRFKNLKIVLTGGDGKLFKKFIKNSVYNPYLTLYGIYLKSLEL